MIENEMFLAWIASIQQFQKGSWSSIMIEEIKPFLDEDTIGVNGHSWPCSNDLTFNSVSTPSSWLVQC